MEGEDLSWWDGHRQIPHCGIMRGKESEWGKVTSPVLLKQFMWEIMRAKGASLAAQWLGLCAATAEAMGSIPGQGTKIPRATWPGQKKNQKERIKRNNESQDESGETERERNRRIPETGSKANRSEWWIGNEMKRKMSRCPFQRNILYFKDIHLKYLNVCKVMTNVPQSKLYQALSLYRSGVLRLGICGVFQQVLTAYRASLTLVSCLSDLIGSLMHWVFK